MSSWDAPKNGHGGSQSPPCSSLPLQAWSCAWCACPFPLWFLPDEKLLLCPELCHHSEGEIGLYIHLSHIGGPVCDCCRCRSWKNMRSRPSSSSFILPGSLSCQALMPVVPAIQHFLKVTNNLHVSKSNGQFSAIVLPDSSATFDTVDRFFLLEVLSLLHCQDTTLGVAP